MKKELVVVTNGLLVATALADASGITVLLTGGVLRLSAMSLVGDLGTDVLRTTRINKGFLGARGLSLERGLMDLNPDEVRIKQEMADACDQVYGILDGTKWHRSALLSFVAADDLTGIVTDSSAPIAEVEAWRAAGADVITVDPGPGGAPPVRPRDLRRAMPVDEEPVVENSRFGPVHEQLAAPPTSIPAPADAWVAATAADLDTLDGLVYRSNLLGGDRTLANQGGGNTSAKGIVIDHAGREQRVLWVKESGTDLATITSAGLCGSPPGRDRAAPLTRVDGRRRDGRLPPAVRARTRSAAAVDRDPAACVHRRNPRRPHAPGRGDRADVVAGGALARRDDVRRRGRCGSTTSAPASPCRSASRTCWPPTRRLAPSCSSATASSRGARRRSRLCEHDRVRDESCRGDRPGRRRSVRSRRSGSCGARGRRVPLPPGADPPRAPRRTPRGCRRRRARGRPQPGSRGIRIVGTRALGEPGRRAVPRPPREHKAQATRRRLRPRE